MTVSTIAGIAFGSTSLHHGVMAPAKDVEHEQSVHSPIDPRVDSPIDPRGDSLIDSRGDSPVESPAPEAAFPKPGNTGNTYSEIDGSYTAAEDRANEAAEFTIPGAYGPVPCMGWACPSGAKGRLAIRSLTKAIDKNPNSSNAYCKRAWVYYTNGQYKKALKDANKSIRLDSKNDAAYQVRSWTNGSFEQ